MTARRWTRRLITTVLVLAVFAFLGAEIVRNAEQLRSFEWRVRPAVLIASLLLLISVLLSGVAVWRGLLRHLGVDIDFISLARTWYLTNISHYIPGGFVWQLVSLVRLGGAAGLTPLVSVGSLLVLMGFMVLAATMVGVLLLPEELAGEVGPLFEALRWATPAGLLLVHPQVIRFALRQSTRLTHRPALEWQASWAEGLWLLLLSAGAWLGSGVAFYLFLRAFVELPSGTLPAVTAVNAIAFVVGYVAFFAPGGLGFKEAALAMLLAGLMPPAVAASLAVAARLWTIAAEVLPALFLLRLRR